MDFITIDRISERDFTSIIEKAGGKRFSENDSTEKEENADYLLGSLIIELKLIEEDGLEKENRQKKIFDLFSQYWCGNILVIDPDILDAEDQNSYSRILEGPIKGHVKKASNQLKATQNRIGRDSFKVAIIFNNGYTALNHEEFREIAVKRAKNDTSNIDYIVTCGIYYYSDGFDMVTICSFEIDPIQGGDDIPDDIGNLKSAWDEFLNQHMTDFIINPNRKKNAKLPVLDIEFKVNERTLIKPSPPFGKKSEFWVNGRPRVNTSGILKCPPVATSFPKFSEEAWEIARAGITDSHELKDTYKDWLEFSQHECSREDDVLRPTVPISIDPKVFDDGNIHINNFTDLCNLANEKFSDKIRKIMGSAKEKGKADLVIDHYVYLVTREIGRDKKNDLSYIFLVRGLDKPEIYKTLVDEKNIFFEHALVLAASYALKFDIDVVLYDKDLKYSWNS